MSKAQTVNAKRYIEKGYQILSEKLGKDHLRTGLAAFHLGKYKLAAKDYDNARTYFLEALASFSDPNKPSNRVELTTHSFLVEVYEQLDERDNATKHCLAIGSMIPYTGEQDYVPLFKKAPTYPYFSAQGGKEGYVTVEYEVDEMGFVKDPRIVDSEGAKAFEKPSLKAAKGFRYAPRFVDGKPVVTEGIQNRFIYKMVKN